MKLHKSLQIVFENLSNCLPITYAVAVFVVRNVVLIIFFLPPVPNKNTKVMKNNTCYYVFRHTSHVSFIHALENSPPVLQNPKHAHNFNCSRRQGLVKSNFIRISRSLAKGFLKPRGNEVCTITNDICPIL